MLQRVGDAESVELMDLAQLAREGGRRDAVADAQPEPLSFVRLCIAKRDSTLDEAAARLNAFAARARPAP